MLDSGPAFWPASLQLSFKVFLIDVGVFEYMNVTAIP